METEQKHHPPEENAQELTGQNFYIFLGFDFFK